MCRCWTCTSSTTWWWDGAAWWRSSTRSSGRRSSRGWASPPPSPPPPSPSGHSKFFFNVFRSRSLYVLLQSLKLRQFYWVIVNLFTFCIRVLRESSSNDQERLTMYVPNIIFISPVFVECCDNFFLLESQNSLNQDYPLGKQIDGQIKTQRHQ